MTGDKARAVRTRRRHRVAVGTTAGGPGSAA